MGTRSRYLGCTSARPWTAATDLRSIGCGFVVAPIAVNNADPFIQFESYAVALYPFIEGRTFSFEESFGEVERGRILEALAVLHKVPIDAIRTPAADGFVIPWLDQLDGSMHGELESVGPHAAVASRLLIDNEAEIRRLNSRYRTLVDRYMRSPGPVVVTHGEIHPGNVMVSAAGLMVIDWDTLMLAPPERDLWRLAHGDASVLRAYADATGTTPNEWLLNLYGVRWDLGEIASFAAELRKPHEDNADTRKALETLRSVIGGLRVSGSTTKFLMAALGHRLPWGFPDPTSASDTSHLGKRAATAWRWSVAIATTVRCPIRPTVA